MKLVVETKSFGGFTDDELYLFCVANQELRIERNSKGQLVFMAPTGLETSFFNTDLIGEIRDWNRKHRLGKVSDSNGGYTLPNGAMRAPDVGFVSNERWETVPTEERKKFARICPDFVVELMSENDTLTESREKMEEWMENGCRLGWLLDPQNRKTYIYRENGERLIRNFSEKLSGENVLPDFELDLTEIFG